MVASLLGGRHLATERIERESKPSRHSDVIRLSVPGALEFRDVAVRVVGTACRLLRPASSRSSDEEPSHGRADFSQDEFSTQVVSAFSEAFNNLAIHGYRESPAGADCRIDLEITSEEGSLVVRLRDFGCSFDPSDYMEVPDALPERGMGLFIIRSFMDEVIYASGPPHVLTLKKRWPGASTASMELDPSLGEQPR